MKSQAVIPRNYNEWKRCIEVDCGIPLTPAFVSDRIEALTRSGSEEASRFARLYGDEHLQRVIGWFQAARAATSTVSSDRA